MDAVDHDVAAATRPMLAAHVNPVHEQDTEQGRLGEVVAREGVRGADRVNTLGGVAPRLAVEGDVPEGAGEAALHELGTRRHPAVDVCAGEAAPFESRLAGANAAQVGAVESALTEHALPAAREERLQTLVERLAAEIATLEDATVRRESLERGATEVRVADGDSIQRENALHALAP